MPIARHPTGRGQYDNAILIHSSSASGALPTWARVFSIATFTSLLRNPSVRSASANRSRAGAWSVRTAVKPS